MADGLDVGPSPMVEVTALPSGGRVLRVLPVGSDGSVALMLPLTAEEAAAVSETASWVLGLSVPRAVCAVRQGVEFEFWDDAAASSTADFQWRLRAGGREVGGAMSHTPASQLVDALYKP